jgi:hypothetical protein
LELYAIRWFSSSIVSVKIAEESLSADPVVNATGRRARRLKKLSFSMIAGILTPF